LHPEKKERPQQPATALSSLAENRGYTGVRSAALGGWGPINIW